MALRELGSTEVLEGAKRSYPMEVGVDRFGGKDIGLVRREEEMVTSKRLS